MAKHSKKQAEQNVQQVKPPDPPTQGTEPMTFAEFDDFCKRSEEIELFNLEPYWPHPDDIELKVLKFPPMYLALFYNWLLEMNGDPRTPEETESKNLMKQFIYQHLKLKD